MSPRIPVRCTGALLGAALLAAGAVPAAAQDAPQPRTAFRVCQDPNNMPFSNDKGDGIENKIAELFAKDLGLPVAYTSFPQRPVYPAFIRNTLRYKVPGQDYPCDVVLGVPAGVDIVSATKPYYRSTYAMVFAKGTGKGLDAVTTEDQFLALPPATLKKLRIGVYDRSPGSAWLDKHKLVDQGVPFQSVSADPAWSAGQIVERDLAQGKIDVAILWGPIAGWSAKQVKGAEMAVVPLKSEAGVKFDFQYAMGVRYGEREWKAQIEGLIDKHRAEIDKILRDYGVPLLELETPAAGRQ